jgi:hypothetical protein
MRKLNEYVDLVLPRASVERARAWLGELSGQRGRAPERIEAEAGTAAWLYRELGHSLDRDRRRVASARVSTVIGEMGVEELLDVVAAVLEMERAGELADGDRELVLADALARAAARRREDQVSVATKT